MSTLKPFIVSLAAVVALAACAPGIPDRWVVEGQLYGRFPEQWSVTCVLASRLSKPYGQRGITREIEVSKTVEETIARGAPCPAGRLLATY